MGKLYIVFFLFLMLFSLCELIRNKNVKLLLYLFPVILIILMGGLRYGISSDYFHYKEMYQHINENANWSYFFVEYGYLWLNFLFFKIYNNFEFFIFFFCFISVLLKTSLIFKYSPYPFLGLIFYFTFYFLLDDMGAIRRGFACSFVIASFFYSFEKKYLRALLFLFFAINIHLSALFCLPFIFLNKYKSSTKSFLISLIISFFLGYIFNNYYDSLIKFNSDFLIYQKFIAYFEPSYQFETNVYEIGLVLRIILVVYLLNKKTIFSEFKYFDNMLNLYLIGIYILIVFSKFTIFSSIVIYFKFFEIFLVTILLSKVKKNNRVYLISFFLLYAFISLYRLTNSPLSDFQTYKSIISN